MIHWQLWPAILGACIALPLLAVAAMRLAQSWSALSRRRRWVFFAALAAAELAVWLNVYAWLVEPNLLVVRRIEVVTPHWHGPPLRIAALADVHAGGPHMRARRVERIVGRVNGLRPDIVVLLGDYVAGHAPYPRAPREDAEIDNAVSYFAALDAPLGVIAAIGNHDVWYSHARISQLLQDAGVATLWNRHVVIERGAHRFIVAGLEDGMTGEPSRAAALDGGPEGLDVIMLQHAPDAFAESDAPDALTLAGHTHCGQVRLPLIGAIVSNSAYGQRYACGLVREQGRVMFVSAGLGTSILPVRFLAPPEIVLITLRSADPANDAPEQPPEEEASARG